jgi:carbonic anhydrase
MFALYGWSAKRWTFDKERVMDTMLRVVRRAKPKTILVSCSDPDFQGIFRHLCTEELKLEEGQVFPITIMGGGLVLAESANRKEERNSVGGQIEDALTEFNSITTIVLVGHADCRRVRLNENQTKRCLQEAGVTTQDCFPNSEIRLFYVGFESIEELPLPRLADIAST